MGSERDRRRCSNSSAEAAGTIIADPALFPPGTLPIIGNRRSKIYHLPNCPNYSDVSPMNRVELKSREAAEGAGYRMARNCP